MISHNVEQGSQAWLDLHIGVLTASRFHRLMTEKTRKASKGEAVHKLACEVAAEWMLGHTLDSGTSQFMQRGTALEKRAVDWYAFHRMVDVEPVGFITNDDESAGCSPDGLVGTDGGVEIKVPSPAKHVGYLTEPESLVDDYRAQCQGGMWITERVWWDLVSWHPSIPSVVQRIERDDKYIAVLREAVSLVNAEVAAILTKHGHRERETQ